MTTNENSVKIPIPLSQLLEPGVDIKGGSKNLLNKKLMCSESGKSYQIIRYDKDLLNHSLYSELGFFRSIILNLCDKKVSCISPPKSLLLDEFINKYRFEDVQVQEFVEGTMINVWWDESNNMWEISTRSSIGANVKFYLGTDSKTFKIMFNEALKESGLDLNNLPKQYCYSFVMQHPENRIVTPFSQTKLYIIDVFDITYKNDEIYVESYNLQSPSPSDQERNLKELLVKNDQIHLPKIYTDCNSYKEYIDKYSSGTISYEIVGIVFKHLNSSSRTKVRNPIYEQVRHLKGNHPKKQYRYLWLRSTGKMKIYLDYFPEDKSDFYDFRNMCHNFIDRVYKYYVGCYIKKEKGLKMYPFEYRTHMIALHRLYVNILKPNDDYIRKFNVIEYFNSLHPSQQMFALNYKMRN